MVAPPCPNTGPPGQSNSSQPSPQCVAARHRFGTSTSGRRIASTTPAPRIPAPPSRCAFANRTTSAAVAQIPPAGPIDRGRLHTGAGWGSSPGSPTCPIAARNRSTSSGSVIVRVSPSGSTIRSRSTSSHTRPVSTSTIRPRILNPLLQ